MMGQRLAYPVLVSGFIGSGKSTLTKKLAKLFRAHYISGSQIHRTLILERLQKKEKLKAKKVSQGFWESKEGRKGTSMRLKDLSIDREVDRRLLKLLHQHPRTVSDDRLMAWLYKGKAIRIWLAASEKEAARRVSQRDHLTMKEVLPTIHQRNRTDKAIYKKLYDIDFGTDFFPFDLVLNNEGFEPKQTFRLVKGFIQMKINDKPTK